MTPSPTTSSISAAALRAASRKVERHAERHAAARDERDQLVRAALAQGWSGADIGQITGLSRARVDQIKHGRR